MDRAARVRHIGLMSLPSERRVARSAYGPWVFASAVSVLLACSPAEPPRGLLLVVVDTLRADHLGSYGYPRQTSPRIDAFAADSIRFEQALAPSPWTLPSLATLMTGLYPEVHGASSPSRLRELTWLFDPGTFRPATALHESRTRIADLLQDEGFATLGLI
jgi:arylsulfatase A-like enzyme